MFETASKNVLKKYSTLCQMLLFFKKKKVILGVGYDSVSIEN